MKYHSRDFPFLYTMTEGRWISFQKSGILITLELMMCKPNLICSAYLIAGVILLSACAGTGFMNDRSGFELNQIKDSTGIKVVHQSFYSSFRIHDSSLAGAVFGAFGESGESHVILSSSENEGNAFVKNTELEDPVIEVQREFLSAARENNSKIPFVPVSDPLADDKTEYLFRVYKEGIVAVFKTTSWGIAPTSASDQFKVYYRVRLKLVDLAKRRPVWDRECAFDGTGTSLAKLKEERGAGVKSELSQAAIKCGQEFASRLVTH